MEYRALLVAPDGDWTIDYRQSSIADVQDALANQGSRWYFYPFHAVILAKPVTTSRQRLLDVASPFEHMRGKTVRTFTRMIAELSDEEKEAILNG